MSARAMVRAAARRRRRTAAGVAAATLISAGAGASGASAIEVNSLADPGNGNCNDGTCTLREAIALSDSTPATVDTITFKSGLSGTINLNGAVGQLDVYWPVTIQGPGPDVVTISGDSDGNGSPDTRVFYLNADGITMSGLTIAKGAGKPNSSAGVSNGGAIYAFAATVAMNDVVLTGNKIQTASGGGIWSGDSDMTITNSKLVGNSAAARGGGISAEEVLGGHSASLEVRDSLIAGNDADYGGGVFTSEIDSLKVERSTVSGNVAGTYGGGGLNEFTDAMIDSSTVAGNNSVGGGGGWAFGQNPTVTRLVNSTVAGNVAGYGGGLLTTSPSSGLVAAYGSIVADNGDEELFAVGDVPKFVVAGSLVEQPEAGAFVQPSGSTNVFGADPQLGPLEDNAGLTPTMMPALTSPAIDAGTANGLTTDQRGLARTVEQPGANGAGSDGTDIGAVERQDETPPHIRTGQKGKAKAGKPIKVTVGSDEAATVSADATSKVGRKKVKFKSASGRVAAGGSVTLKLKLAKRPAKVLKKAGEARAKVHVAAEDATGNTTDEMFKLKLK